MAIVEIQSVLEIHADRGVVYIHGVNGVSLMRISNINPERLKQFLLTEGGESQPFLDLTNKLPELWKHDPGQQSPEHGEGFLKGIMRGQDVDQILQKHLPEELQKHNYCELRLLQARMQLEQWITEVYGGIAKNIEGGDKITQPEVSVSIGDTTASVSIGDFVVWDSEAGFPGTESQTDFQDLEKFVLLCKASWIDQIQKDYFVLLDREGLMYRSLRIIKEKAMERGF